MLKVSIIDVVECRLRLVFSRCNAISAIDECRGVTRAALFPGSDTSVLTARPPTLEVSSSLRARPVPAPPHQPLQHLQRLALPHAYVRLGRKVPTRPHTRHPRGIHGRWGYILAFSPPAVRIPIPIPVACAITTALAPTERREGQGRRSPRGRGD